MNRKDVNWRLSSITNIGVLFGLVFVGYEVSQNTVQLRAESSQAITESVNALNAGMYSDPELAEILIRGTEDLGALDSVERARFDQIIEKRSTPSSITTGGHRGLLRLFAH